MSKTLTMKDRITQFARTAKPEEIAAARDFLDFALEFRRDGTPAPEVKRGRPVGSRNKPPAEASLGVPG